MIDELWDAFERNSDGKLVAKEAKEAREAASLAGMAGFKFASSTNELILAREGGSDTDCTVRFRMANADTSGGDGCDVVVGVPFSPDPPSEQANNRCWLGRRYGDRCG